MSDLDRTLSVGDTALVIGSDPEVMVKITAAVGKDRVLAEVIYGPELGAKHGYDRHELSKRLSLYEALSSTTK